MTEISDIRQQIMQRWIYRPRVIGIHGPIGAGKTTVAKILEDDLGYKRLRFAQGLKDMLYAIDLDKECVDGDRKLEPLDVLGGKTARHAQQTLGTEWGRRMIHPDIWANILANRIKTEIKKFPLTSHFVIDDLRFPNEYAALREAFGGSFVSIKVRRKGVEPLEICERLAGLLGPRLTKFLLRDPRLHVSELHWRNMPCDQRIHNDEGLYRLCVLALQVVLRHAEEGRTRP
jgi:hypothetical protein